jgi:hypothetical protein
MAANRTCLFRSARPGQVGQDLLHLPPATLVDEHWPAIRQVFHWRLYQQFQFLCLISADLHCGFYSQIGLQGHFTQDFQALASTILVSLPSLR